MSDLFKLIYTNGLTWGFTCGMASFFLGYAIRGALALFEI